jgi:hypothetical protein
MAARLAGSRFSASWRAWPRHRRRGHVVRGARGFEALGENLLRLGMELVEGDASRAAHCLRFPLSSRADTLGSRHGPQRGRGLRNQ